MAEESGTQIKGSKSPAKTLKKFGWSFLIELVPFVGFLWPGDLVLVWKTINGDFTSPEGILMLVIASVIYIVKLVSGGIEFFFDLSIFTTLATWLSAGFFTVWRYTRNDASPVGETREKGGEDKIEQNTEKAYNKESNNKK